MVVVSVGEWDEGFALKCKLSSVIKKTLRSLCIAFCQEHTLLGINFGKWLFFHAFNIDPLGLSPKKYDRICQFAVLTVFRMSFMARSGRLLFPSNWLKRIDSSSSLDF